jgi:hypothetical protein
MARFSAIWVEISVDPRAPQRFRASGHFPTLFDLEQVGFGRFYHGTASRISRFV